jgi:hypothetical protein
MTVGALRAEGSNHAPFRRAVIRAEGSNQTARSEIICLQSDGWQILLSVWFGLMSEDRGER